MKGDLLGVAIGLVAILVVAAIWSLLPFWLIAVASVVLVVWMIGVNKSQGARYQRDLDEAQRQCDAAHDDQA